MAPETGGKAEPEAQDQTVFSAMVPDKFAVQGDPVPPGTTLNGIYVVDERIARGGMGEVFAGRNIQTGHKVAIKMILPEHAQDDLIISLFRREADVLHGVNHEAIVRYFLFSVDPELGRPYLVMEFAEGPSLADHLKAHGPLSKEDLDTLRNRVAGGLHAAHRKGVFHRDISPDNIILVGGSVEGAQIIDFGIAKMSDNPETLIGSSLAGKMNYISPEQLGLNGGMVTAQSDIYSLGLVLAQAATGTALKMTGSQVDIVDKRREVPDLSAVSSHLRPLLELMLAPKPEDRPTDMAFVADWSGGKLPRGKRSVSDAKNEKRCGRGWLHSILLILALAGGGGMLAHEASKGKLDGIFAHVATLAAVAQPEPVVKARVVLEPVQEDVVAPAAKVGQSYDWSSTPFAYSGTPKDLLIRSIGKVPPGLIFSRDAEGVSNLAGVPTESGSFSFLIDAESPEGLVAEQIVIVTVNE